METVPVVSNIKKENMVTKYKPITSSSEILEKLKMVLSAKENKEADCVSLYTVFKLIKQINYDYKRIINCYETRISYILKREGYDDGSVSIISFDYKKNELQLLVNLTGKIGGDKKIYFAKDKEDIYISKIEKDFYYHDANRFFAKICSELSPLFDHFIKYNDYKNTMGSYNVEAVNTDFLVNMYDDGVSISIRNQSKIFENDFKLSASIGSFREYYYDCNSSKVLEVLNGNESEIFKKIFVKISDCPIWCQSELYNIRQKELEELKSKENEMRINNTKKLKLINKMFSSLKK